MTNSLSSLFPATPKGFTYFSHGLQELIRGNDENGGKNAKQNTKQPQGDIEDRYLGTER